MTVVSAAQLAGVGRQTWVRLERSDSYPRGDTAAKVSIALQWPPDALARIRSGEDPAAIETVDAPLDPADKAEARRRRFAAAFELLDEEGQLEMIAHMRAQLAQLEEKSFGGR